MRAIGVLVAVAALFAGCSLVRQPPTSADTQFSVVVYNQTEAPVFVLAHEVPACGSVRLAAADTLLEGVTPPPGVAPFPGSVKITTPRDYTGTVSVVLTAGRGSFVVVGGVAAASLPPCRGTA